MRPVGGRRGLWPSLPVHKSNCRDASPPRLNHDLHAIDATPAGWRVPGGLSPLDSVIKVAFSSRKDLVKNYRVHPTHWLIYAQVRRTRSARMRSGRLRTRSVRAARTSTLRPRASATSWAARASACRSRCGARVVRSSRVCNSVLTYPSRRCLDLSRASDLPPAVRRASSASRHYAIDAPLHRCVPLRTTKRPLGGYRDLDGPRSRLWGCCSPRRLLRLQMGHRGVVVLVFFVPPQTRVSRCTWLDFSTGPEPR